MHSYCVVYRVSGSSHQTAIEQTVCSSFILDFKKKVSGNRLVSCGSTRHSLIHIQLESTWLWSAHFTGSLATCNAVWLIGPTPLTSGSLLVSTIDLSTHCVDTVTCSTAQCVCNVISNLDRVLLLLQRLSDIISYMTILLYDWLWSVSPLCANRRVTSYGHLKRRQNIMINSKWRVCLREPIHP